MAKWSGRGSEGTPVKEAEDNASFAELPSLKLNTLVPSPFQGKQSTTAMAILIAIIMLLSIVLYIVLSLPHFNSSLVLNELSSENSQ